MNILEMAKQGLKSDLEAAINNARSIKAESQTMDVNVKVNNLYQTINLIVKPVLTKETDLGTMMIVFASAEKSNNHPSDKNSKTIKKKIPQISELEKELTVTR